MQPCITYGAMSPFLAPVALASRHQRGGAGCFIMLAHPPSRVERFHTSMLPLLEASNCGSEAEDKGHTLPTAVARKGASQNRHGPDRHHPVPKSHLPHLPRCIKPLVHVELRPSGPIRWSWELFMPAPWAYRSLETDPCCLVTSVAPMRAKTFRLRICTLCTQDINLLKAHAPLQ